MATCVDNFFLRLSMPITGSLCLYHFPHFDLPGLTDEDKIDGEGVKLPSHQMVRVLGGRRGESFVVIPLVLDHGIHAHPYILRKQSKLYKKEWKRDNIGDCPFK